MASEVDYPRSTKNAWVLLCGSSLLKSKEFIGSELQKSALQIISGVTFYKPNDKNKNINEEIKKHKIEDVPADFLEKLSIILNLEPIQSYELFCAYLMYEYKGTPASMIKLFTNEKNTKYLLNQLWKYYHSERLFSLLCLKMILSHWQESSSHPYKDLFRDFLENANQNGDILTNLITQIKILINSNAPSRLSNGPYFSDELAENWKNYNLKEQSEVLQLILLYFKQFESKTSIINELLTLFQLKPQLQFNQIASEKFDDSLSKFINFLKSLIIVQCLDLKWLCNCQEQEINEHHLFKDSQSLKELNSKIFNLNSAVDYYSPIFLSWMLVRSWEFAEFDAISSPNVVMQMGKIALDLNVFNYLLESVHLAPFVSLKNTFVSNCIFSTIETLISVTFTLYNIEETGFSMDSLHQLCLIVFQNDSIANNLFISGLDNDLGIIIKQSLIDFPLETKTVLNYCCSLSETNSCKKIFEELSILSNLTCYTEVFNISTTVPTQQENTFVLIEDKTLYNDQDLVIKKNTFGSIKKYNNQVVIQWKNTNINGWKILFYRLKNLFDFVTHGHSNAISNDNIIEMTRVATLFSNLINHQSFNHIPNNKLFIELFFECYQVFSLFQFPPRIFMASVLNLATSFIKNHPQDMLKIWEKLNAKKFLPFMIGLTNDLDLLLKGKDTMSSKLGEIIASEECIRGHYELCISFLDLLSKVLNTNSMKNDENVLASFIYVINEILPVYNEWNYFDKEDCTKIGRLCFDMLNCVLEEVKKTGENCKLEKICVLAFTIGSAAEKIFNIIKHGKSLVKRIVVDSGSDMVLSQDNNIMIVRQSLSTLNILLNLNKNVKVPLIIENALFSTKIKPNMLLVLSHYVFQRYDINLAVLAVGVLKRLAKRIPMSLLACLGSEAESIRDHFLFRLEAVTEDLRLKIALLDFLSTCAQHQPGLMEMFINVINDGHNNDESGCLQTVLEILQEKKEGKYFCPFELHTAALKFVLTFWLQPHLFAIDLLRKNAKLWTLITFPLFESQLNNKLCTYVFRILAREIFYIKTQEGGKFHNDIEEIFKKIVEQNKLVKYSLHVCVSVNGNIDYEEVLLLLASWKEFTASLARFNPFNVSKEVKCTLIEDLMNCFLAELQTEKPRQKILKLLSDSIVILFHKWHSLCIGSLEQWNQRNIQILNAFNEKIQEIPFSVLISTQMVLIKFLYVHENEQLVLSNLHHYIYSVCGLLNENLMVFEKQIKSGNCSNTIESRLIVSSVLLLKLIVKNATQQTACQEIIKTRSIMESISCLLLYLIEHKLGLELANAIFYLLITFSSNVSTARSLLKCGIFEKICLSLQILYENEIEKKINKQDLKYSWNYTFHLSLRLTIVMLQTLKHEFVESAITYVAVHLEHFCAIFSALQTMPIEDQVYECALIIKLTHELSFYSTTWRTHHNYSYEKLTNEITNISKTITGLLVRPNILARIEQPQELTSSMLPSTLTKDQLSKNIIQEKLGIASSKDNQILTQLKISKSLHTEFQRIQSYSLAILYNIHKGDDD